MKFTLKTIDYQLNKQKGCLVQGIPFFIGEKMNKIYLIGNAHLDPVWLWRWQEGFAEIKATFKSALDRMKQFDDFKFTSACGAYYMWIEQSDPKMFREIQQRVREGRWILVGGWFIQPDCNVPTGESYARHSLITQRYFYEKFGKIATTGYNVDSFGHNGNLPQILRLGRMENYVFMRPGAHEKTLPQHLFLWEGRDGSQVKAYRIHNLYNVSLHSEDTFAEIERIDEGTDQMAFYGVGNHGGGPTVELLEWMHKNLSDRFVYSDPNEFFANQITDDLPVVRDDLQFHAKGCYSAVSEIKKNNRYAENSLLMAEKLMTLSGKLIGTPYPANDLKYAWERVLFNQFHDIMGGCCIREAVDDSRWVYGEAISIADRILNFAIQQISWNIDTVSDGGADDYVSSERAEKMGYPIVIFNPLDHEVTAAVHVRCFNSFEGREDVDESHRNKYMSVTDNDGNPLPIQTVRDSKTDEGKKYARLVGVRVPALGYTVCRMHNTKGEAIDNPFTFTENSIANGKIKVSFAENGEIISIVDLTLGRELLSAPSSLGLYDDEKHDTWAHNIKFFKDKLPEEAKGSFKITEQGPVRATVRTEQTIGTSTVIRDYSIYADSDAIDVKVKIDFNEKFRILKLSYPVACSSPKAYCKIPFGVIERSTDGSEYPCGDWVSMSDEMGGITVATDSKHSFDADGNVLSITVLRSCIFADHYGARDEFCEFTEQGEHFFKYRISPFTSFADAERNAAELQQQPFAIAETFHHGDLPSSYSGITVSKSNVSVTAIKQSEDGNGIILRCYETDGKDTDVEISVFGNKLAFHIPHDSIKTYLVGDGFVKEVDFLEWEV